MLQPTMQLRYRETHQVIADIFSGETVMTSKVLQQKWEHPNNVDDEGFPHLGEWRDIGVERE